MYRPLCQAGATSLHDRFPLTRHQNVAEMAVHVYDFKPSLAPDMEGAALIISHAGAGCIMESLRSDSVRVASSHI